MSEEEYANYDTYIIVWSYDIWDDMTWHDICKLITDEEYARKQRWSGLRLVSSSFSGDDEWRQEMRKCSAKTLRSQFNRRCQQETEKGPAFIQSCQRDPGWGGVLDTTLIYYYAPFLFLFLQRTNGVRLLPLLHSLALWWSFGDKLIWIFSLCSSRVERSCDHLI